MTRTVLDHVALATRVLTDGWDLFGSVLGGRWAYGGNDPGCWWGQLNFRTGPKIELLTPTGGPGIGDTLARVRALGIEPVKVNLDSATWKEAFLHPGDAYGIVIQIAQQSGPPPHLATPPELPEPGAASDFVLTELRVDDIDSAVRLYSAALEGEVASRSETDTVRAAELIWPHGARIRLVQRGASALAAPGQQADCGLSRLGFSRDAPDLSLGEPARIATLSRRLGVSLALND